MYELKLIMEHTGTNQQVVASLGEPFKQLRYQAGDTFCRRRQMHQARFRKNTTPLAPELPGIVSKSCHHGAVGTEQVVDAERIERRIHVVGCYGILYLLNLPRRCHNCLPLNDVCHLPFRQLIALNG